MEELTSTKTPVTESEISLALAHSWQRFFGISPKTSAIKVLIAQWALETGWGKSMRCFNVGNMKYGSTAESAQLNFQFFACNEMLTPRQASKYASDPRVKVSPLGSNGKHVVWFYPDHPACKFVAFRSLEEGAFYYLKTLVNRFSVAWPEVEKGDPVAFAYKLKEAQYYTADSQMYAEALREIVASLQLEPWDLSPLEKERISKSVAEGLETLRIKALQK